MTSKSAERTPTTYFELSQHRKAEEEEASPVIGAGAEYPASSLDWSGDSDQPAVPQLTTEQQLEIEIRKHKRLLALLRYNQNEATNVRRKID